MEFFSRESLKHSLSGIGVNNVNSLFQTLAHLYNSPDRYYHNSIHIAESLKSFRQVEYLSEFPSEVEAALWFHDAIYDTKKADNEKQSADLAKDLLEKDEVITEVLARIYQLILDTRHDAVPQTTDGRLLVDIDLGILGQDWEVFEAYDRAIRKEYAWVEEETYRTGRAAILQGFLQRERIYLTDYFKERLELKARLNLNKVLKLLSG